MRDRKLHKLLGVEDEAKWLAKILDSRYEIENGPSSLQSWSPVPAITPHRLVKNKSWQNYYTFQGFYSMMTWNILTRVITYFRYYTMHGLIKHPIKAYPTVAGFYHTLVDYLSLPVREITKNSSTFSATNFSSNIVWSISTAWYNPNEIKWNLILVPNLVAFIS